MQTTRDIVKEKSIEKQKKGKDQIETWQEEQCWKVNRNQENG
jgi:hypothetical protein